jgi:hypothetical protein
VRVEHGLAATALALALALAPACGGPKGGVRLVAAPPPPPPAQVQPRPGQIFVSGHWDQHDGTWAWSDGYWVPQRPGYTWVDGEWIDAGGYWRWRAGHWTLISDRGSASPGL